MPTPKDNPDLLNEWKDLERVLTNCRFSRYKAYEHIAKKYGTSVTNVYYWLTDYGAKNKNRTKIYFKEHKEEEKKRKKVNYYLDAIILEIFDSPILSLRNISNKIKQKTGIRVSDNSIINIIKKYETSLGDDSPITEFGEHQYRLNINSPYYKLCGLVF